MLLREGMVLYPVKTQLWMGPRTTRFAVLSSWDQLGFATSSSNSKPAWQRQQGWKMDLLPSPASSLSLSFQTYGISKLWTGRPHTSYLE